MPPLFTLRRLGATQFASCRSSSNRRSTLLWPHRIPASTPWSSSPFAHPPLRCVCCCSCHILRVALPLLLALRDVVPCHSRRMLCALLLFAGPCAPRVASASASAAPPYRRCTVVVRVSCCCPLLVRFRCTLPNGCRRRSVLCDAASARRPSLGRTPRLLAAFACCPPPCYPSPLCFAADAVCVFSLLLAVFACRAPPYRPRLLRVCRLYPLLRRSLPSVALPSLLRRCVAARCLPSSVAALTLRRCPLPALSHRSRAALPPWLHAPSLFARFTRCGQAPLLFVFPFLLDPAAMHRACDQATRPTRATPALRLAPTHRRHSKAIVMLAKRKHARIPALYRYQLSSRNSSLPPLRPDGVT